MYWPKFPELVKTFEQLLFIHFIITVFSLVIPQGDYCFNPSLEWGINRDWGINRGWGIIVSTHPQGGELF